MYVLMQVTKLVSESPKHNQTPSHMDVVASSLSGVLVSSLLCLKLTVFVVSWGIVIVDI